MQQGDTTRARRAGERIEAAHLSTCAGRTRCCEVCPVPRFVVSFKPHLIPCPRLLRNGRSYPFHVHIIRSILHLTKHTNTYVPLAPYLLPILTSTLSASSKPKASTLRPFDFDTHIRAPQQYVKTRVYNEGLAEESTFLLAEYLANPPVHGSIGFPEVTVPIVLLLRKAVKGAKNAQGKGAKSKEAGLAKALVERVEESAKWAEQRRKGVLFAPGKLGEVERWEEDLAGKLDDTPLGRYVKVQRKAREKRRKLVEKVRAALLSSAPQFARRVPPQGVHVVAQSPWSRAGRAGAAWGTSCRMLIPILFRPGAAGRGRGPGGRLNAAGFVSHNAHDCAKLPARRFN